MGDTFNWPSFHSNAAIQLLLLLLPLLPAMAMEGGLRKGDAHGVPGKTMLFGNRPVPLKPGVNAAPKPPNIKMAGSKKDRVQSLLVDQSGGGSTSTKKGGVPSLLDGGNKISNKGKVPSLLEGKERKLAQSLLLTPPATTGQQQSPFLDDDDQVEYLAVKIPSNEEEPLAKGTSAHLKKKHAYKYLKVFLDWFEPPFTYEVDTLLARLNQATNWRNMFLEELFGVGVRVGTFSLRPPSGNKLIDHVEAQFNELERSSSKEATQLDANGKTALAVWILFGPAVEILRSIMARGEDNHHHPWGKSCQCEGCQKKEVNLMERITANSAYNLDELVQNANGLREGIGRELNKIDSEWTAQNMQKFEQSWTSFRRSFFQDGHSSIGGSGGQTFRRRGVPSLLS